MAVIDAWERFLRSLETEGGKLVVLLTMIAFFVAVAVFETATGHPLQDVGRTLLATGIGSLLGIIYGYLAKGTPHDR